MGDLLFLNPLTQILNELNELNKETLITPLIAEDINIEEISSDNEGKREIKITPSQSSKYKGEVSAPGVKYSRYLWDRLFQERPVIYTLRSDMTIQDAIISFCEQYKIPLFNFDGNYMDIGPSANLDFPLHFYENNQAEIGQPFSEKSIGYTGMFSLLVIKGNRPVEELDLSKLILNRELKGLIYPS